MSALSEVGYLHEAVLATAAGKVSSQLSVRGTGPAEQECPVVLLLPVGDYVSPMYAGVPVGFFSSRSQHG